MVQNCPLVPGFASTEVLEGKWPLFARTGVLGNLELAWSEFLAVWGLEPVRVVLRASQPRLGLELGAALSRYLDESHEIS